MSLLKIFLSCNVVACTEKILQPDIYIINEYLQQ